MRLIVRVSGAAACLIALLLLGMGSVEAASGPASTKTLAVGPYIVDFNLYQDPPYADTPLAVSVAPRESHMRLQGEIIAEPGLGTDAIPLHFQLRASGSADGTLTGTIRMPVRGAWNIVIQLRGPRGAGTGLVPVTVTAPGAMPVWLAWLIGAAPLALVAFWVWRQHVYKQDLLKKAHGDGGRADAKAG